MNEGLIVTIKSEFERQLSLRETPIIIETDRMGYMVEDICEEIETKINDLVYKAIEKRNLYNGLLVTGMMCKFQDLLGKDGKPRKFEVLDVTVSQAKIMWLDTGDVGFISNRPCVIVYFDPRQEEEGIDDSN